VDELIRFRSHFPGGDSRRAPQTFLRGEKTFGGTESAQGTAMGNGGEWKAFGFSGFPKSDGGKQRGLEGG